MGYQNMKVTVVGGWLHFLPKGNTVDDHFFETQIVYQSAFAFMERDQST
jgi:hypothetical protein